MEQLPFSKTKLGLDKLVFLLVLRTKGCGEKIYLTTGTQALAEGAREKEKEKHMLYVICCFYHKAAHFELPGLKASSLSKLPGECDDCIFTGRLLSLGEVSGRTSWNRCGLLGMPPPSQLGHFWAQTEPGK